MKDKANKTPSPPVPSIAPSAPRDPSHELPRVSEKRGLSQNVGKAVILTGNPTTLPRQHVMGKHLNYPFTEYIDLSDGYQVGVYLMTRIPEKLPVEITGRVIETHAPGPEETKSSETAYQLVAESWHYCA
jgi:hypothetical protein